MALVATIQPAEHKEGPAAFGRWGLADSGAEGREEGGRRRRLAKEPKLGTTSACSGSTCASSDGNRSSSTSSSRSCSRGDPSDGDASGDRASGANDATDETGDGRL